MGAVATQLRRLSGLRFAPELLQTHEEALASVGPDDLFDAISLAQRECRDFPSPVELLEFVHRVRIKRAGATPDPVVERPAEPVDVAITHFGETVAKVKVTRDYAHECDVCDDSGWKPIWCGIREAMPGVLQLRGAQFGFCGEGREHYPHEFAVACPCRPTNRTYRLKLEKLAAGARKRTDARS